MPHWKAQYGQWVPGSAGMLTVRQTRAAVTPTAPQVVRQRRLTLVSPTKRNQRQGGEDQESRLVVAGELLGEAEAGGEIEAADAAGHADQAGHHADLARKRCGTSWNTAPLPMPSASMATTKIASAIQACGRPS